MLFITSTLDLTENGFSIFPMFVENVRTCSDSGGYYVNGFTNDKKNYELKTGLRNARVKLEEQDVATIMCPMKNYFLIIIDTNISLSRRKVVLAKWTKTYVSQSGSSTPSYG